MQGAPKEEIRHEGETWIDYQATKKLVDAYNRSFHYSYINFSDLCLGLNIENDIFVFCHGVATVAKVDHFILVTSLGKNKIDFPVSILKWVWKLSCVSRLS
jgi:hypothetical protein